MSEIVCWACGIPLRLEEVRFCYLGHEFYETALRCPNCSQIHIPEELAKGKMAEVEAQLEEK